MIQALKIRRAIGRAKRGNIMNKYRSLENIIRDVAAGRAPISEKMGMMSAIRSVGKKPMEAPLAQEPEDNTISPTDSVKDHIVTSSVSKEIQTTLSHALNPSTDVHAARKDHAVRSQRKLKIIDNT
jgi:hypothetical protein